VIIEQHNLYFGGAYFKKNCGEERVSILYKYPYNIKSYPVTGRGDP
jgi:hypothetical protein